MPVFVLYDSSKHLLRLWHSIRLFAEKDSCSRQNALEHGKKSGPNFGGSGFGGTTSAEVADGSATIVPNELMISAATKTTMLAAVCARTACPGLVGSSYRWLKR